jgi:uncharacterized protein YcbK (DUF882 family)
MPFETFDRRQFLIAGLGAAAGLVLPGAPALAALGRDLSFVNLHTGETLATTYWQGGRHLPSACHRIDTLLRDYRTGDIAPISTRLLDLLHAIRTQLGTEGPFEVISGYRSPKTNARLASASKGVARKSLHMQGMAVDIRVPHCTLKRLRAVAVDLRGGGVGYYPKSGFVHVDVGRVRYW